jgi:Co/Zn/Cd efflux system component
MACCDHTGAPFDGVSTAYRRALLAVIAINATMFAVEVAAGLGAGSRALLADALDFAGDALTYAITLWAIGRPLRTRARAALLKGLSLALMAFWVLATTAWQVVVQGMPRAEVMGVIGLLAFAANLASVLILVRWKDGDANVRSVWLCSRNDAIGNLAVIAAAGGVWATATAWPDLVVAAAMAGLFLTSSLKILRQAGAELRAAPATA